MSKKDQQAAKSRAVHKTFIAPMSEIDEINVLAIAERRPLSSMAGILISEALKARKAAK